MKELIWRLRATGGQLEEHAPLLDSTRLFAAVLTKADIETALSCVPCMDEELVASLVTANTAHEWAVRELHAVLRWLLPRQSVRVACRGFITGWEAFDATAQARWHRTKVLSEVGSRLVAAGRLDRTDLWLVQIESLRDCTTGEWIEVLAHEPGPHEDDTELLETAYTFSRSHYSMFEDWRIACMHAHHAQSAPRPCDRQPMV